MYSILTMQNFIKKYRLSILGILLGGIGGYLYYHFIGCTTGSCAITSKPFNSTVYGMVMGYLLFSIAENSTKKTKSENEIFS